MRDDSTLDDYFAQDKESRQREWLNRRYLAKLRRKMIFVLLGFVIILTLPFLYDRNLPFNTFYNEPSTFIRGVPFGVFDVAIIYYILTLAALYMLYLAYRMIQIRSSLASLSPSRVEKLVVRFDLVSFAVHLVAFYMVANAFFFSFASISGHSMEPTLNDGDNIVLRHAFVDYERYDLVVVSTKNHEEIDDFMIKRIIGLPGETLSIEDGSVYIDGVELHEPYLGNALTYCSNNHTCTFELEEDEYFLMGDNRQNSYDSRNTGSFSIDDFYGRVRTRLYPFQDMGRVE